MQLTNIAKCAIILLSGMAAAPCNASPQDCGILYRPGDTVVTPDGIGTIKTCDSLRVMLKNSTEISAKDALPIMRPIPRSAPDWYGRALDPNFEGAARNH